MSCMDLSCLKGSKEEEDDGKLSFPSDVIRLQRIIKLKESEQNNQNEVLKFSILYTVPKNNNIKCYL